MRIRFQERLIAKNAWRDYSSSANTNFAFEAFETEEKKAFHSPPPPVSSLSRPREMMASNGHSVDNHNQHVSQQMQQQPSHQQMHQHNQRNSVSAMVPGPRATYSLPRAPGPRQYSTASPGPGPTQGYYTQDRRNMPRYNSKGSGGQHTNALQPQPDFYFMPSQRKYSGEVVRVYVDYGNQKPK